MKKWISVIAVITIAATMLNPTEGYAKSKTISQIDAELKKLQQQAKQAKIQQEKAADKKQEAQHYVNKNQAYLKQVLAQIDTVSNELVNIAMDIEDTKANLRDTANKLDETKQRIEERSGLLDTRVRIMYTDGAVSYLDVLLSSTSFSDFLQRADSLQAIMNQDKVLLDEHKHDKELLQDQQQQLEQDYAKVKTLYAQAEDRRSILEEKEREKQQLIAKYSDQIDQQEEITEEQNKLLVELATKRSALENEKKKIKAAQIVKAKTTTKKVSYSASGGFTGNGGSMMVPVNGARLSSGYGTRVHPVTGKVKSHTGVDLAVSEGTDIHAAEGGVVIVAEWWSGYGNTVVIDHGNNVWTLYGHIRTGGTKVQVGDTVKKGEKIAEVGQTGVATGPHVHFEVRINGNPVDPTPYL
ncbi:murein hydrolase activator EnvC family protein [Paenibacillus motobuensis]|uniref:Peptidoglycan DD-metalloendopeptidase family protein n=1 Tax=Paenibacillus motobuensis TaxID=295324 RepID=A0ABP3HS39_9BACL